MAARAPVCAGPARPPDPSTPREHRNRHSRAGDHAERVFEGRGYRNKAVTHTGYDVGPDGRFLVIGDNAPQAEVLTVILNWFEELNRLVPVK